MKLAVLAIAIVAAYALGRRASSKKNEVVDQSRRDLRRAQTVARELDKVSTLIRKQISKHQTRVCKFKQRVAELSMCEHEEAWQALCQEAEDMLRPTLQLAAQIASAYDTIRQQSGNLMTFTDVRTDPLTGIANRRALDDTLHSQFAMMLRYDSSFSLVMFDIDHFKRINDSQGHLQGDRILQEVARLLDDFARETDTVARYGGEEFVVIMPHTNLDGAAVFADRIRARIDEKMPVTISGGVTSVLKSDTAESLLARTDKALYDAKKAGRNCVFQHDGQHSALVQPEKADDSRSVTAV
jgi:diguanylate cyclase